MYIDDSQNYYLKLVKMTNARIKQTILKLLWNTGFYVFIKI